VWERATSLSSRNDGRIFCAGRQQWQHCQQLQHGRSVSDNRWHHIAYVYDQTVSGSIAIYIDGAPEPAAEQQRGVVLDAHAAVRAGPLTRSLLAPVPRT